MTRREHEFMILFNALWYKDFPIIKDFLGFGTRAGWTLHIATAVREAANLMGLFMTFETGGRTDGEIHMFDETAESERKTWAKVEWEWTRAIMPQVNEFKQLKNAADAGRCEVAIFFGRYNTRELDDLLVIVKEHWDGAQIPLLCFFLERTRAANVPGSNPKKKVAIFGKLLTYRLALSRSGGITVTLLRTQPAYPWDVKGTKWAAHRSKELPASPFEPEDEE